MIDDTFPSGLQPALPPPRTLVCVSCWPCGPVVRNRQRPNAPVDSAANTAVVAHLGNVAFKVGRKLDWNHEARQFTGDAEANAVVR